MKKIISLICCLFIFKTGIALAEVKVVPDEFQIREHWISLTTSFDIKTKNEKLGTLYRKFFSLLLTYEFFDNNDQKAALARSRFFSLTAHFDIYDNADNIIGMANEKFFAFFPTFDIYSADGSIKQASAAMNFWGTTFTLYDPNTDQAFATMHRPFFRLKNDWTINITDRELFNTKNIDPRVLMTVLAFQGDKEYWESVSSAKAPQHTLALRASAKDQAITKIQTLASTEQLNEIKSYNEADLEMIAKELEDNFISIFGINWQQSDIEKLNLFINYCLDQLKDKTIPKEKKEAIIYLLKARLN